MTTGNIRQPAEKYSCALVAGRQSPWRSQDFFKTVAERGVRWILLKRGIRGRIKRLTGLREDFKKLHHGLANRPSRSFAAYDTEIGMQGRKRMIGDFRPGGRHRPDKHRLAGTRQTAEDDVRQQLEFKRQMP